MRIKCNVCYGVARIQSRDAKSDDMVRLYCRCTSVGCAHSFVMLLSYSHTIRPAMSIEDQELESRLASLSKSSLQELRDRLGMSYS